MPSPALSALTGKVATFSLLQIRFVCRVAVDGDLPPIWEAFAQEKGGIEGLATLNQILIRGLASCLWLFGWRAQFSAFLPLITLVQNVRLLNLSLDPE